MRTKLSTFALAALLAVLLAGPAGAALWSSDETDKAPVTMDSQTLARLAEQLRPAVVNIDTVGTVTEGPLAGRDMPKDFRDFFERFFGQIPEQKQRRQGTGSGFIISTDGYIVTNNHVVAEADKITVRLLDKRQFKAEVVGRDPKTDVALIKIKASGLPVATLGNSDKLKIGEWVLAIGNPFGLDFTVTAGIVSAKGRVIGAGPYDDFIQTDAAINPGNSGGPLINFNGQVVGMNTAIIAQAQGVGFAVPVNVVKEIVSQLKDKGKVTRAELGVMIQPVTKELAESFGLKEPKGALISQVLPGSPAEKAGLKQGDIIVEFNGKEIDTFHDLPKVVNVQPVGSKAKVKFIRDGKSDTTTVTLGEQRERGEVEAKEPDGKPSEAPKLGLKIQDITPEIAEGLGLTRKEGVVVTEVAPSSPAQSAGLKRGDVILEANRKTVKSAADFAALVGKADKAKPLLLLVQRGGSTIYLPLKWQAE